VSKLRKTNTDDCWAVGTIRKTWNSELEDH
jgi:hypothetical protein